MGGVAADATTYQLSQLPPAPTPPGQRPDRYSFDSPEAYDTALPVQAVVDRSRTPIIW